MIMDFMINVVVNVWYSMMIVHVTWITGLWTLWLMFHVVFMMFATCFGLWYMLPLAIRMCTYMYGVPQDHQSMIRWIRRDHQSFMRCLMSGPTGSLTTWYNVCSFRFTSWWECSYWFTRLRLFHREHDSFWYLIIGS